MTVLFDQEVRIQHHNNQIGPSTSILTQKVHRIRVETVEGQRETMLTIELSDPNDDSFLCKRRITAVDFSQMKTEQGLDKHLKFDGFGSVIVDLLNEALDREVVLEIAHCSVDNDTRYCRLDFVRKVSCRRVTDLAVKLPIVTGTELIEHLLSNNRILKDKQRRLDQLVFTLENERDDMKKQLESEAERSSQLQENVDELQAKTSDLEHEVTILRTDVEMAQGERDRSNAALDEQSEEMLDLKAELESLEDEIDRLQSRLRHLEPLVQENKDLKAEIKEARRMIKQFHEINKENTARLERRIVENGTLIKTNSDQEKEIQFLKKQIKDLNEENDELRIRARQAEAALGLEDRPTKILANNMAKENIAKEVAKGVDVAAAFKPLPAFKAILHSDSPKPTKLGQIARNSATLRHKKPSDGTTKNR
ncbi:unnamed protein product [Bursaphelenchus xylophilus]|uniref:(pine wood nematode) hypothetical protein n=1 Tax=Bursaphelenchus xylophilus TaxID=6326 RepID=A0A1I7S4E6_BURXY|nr:unnamed protein product [Bursaphelenchus xylophilus]CAG9117012.1 unnamed protein product [Bursaphelenchus xylophilus]